jgi:hypothetical protein
MRQSSPVVIGCRRAIAATSASAIGIGGDWNVCPGHPEHATRPEARPNVNACEGSVL